MCTWQPSRYSIAQIEDLNLHCITILSTRYIVPSRFLPVTASMRLLLLLAACLATAAAADHDTTPGQPAIPTIKPILAQDGVPDVQDPMNFGAMPEHNAMVSARHRQERAHLLKRLDRKHGKWTSSHPRYRLLEALYGFSKYRDTNMAELNRVRGLYKNVSKSQKKVSDDWSL
jgi:hypothetical protein